MNMNIKDHVSDNKKVRFVYFKEGSLFYETELGLIFEVPSSDTGNGTFGSVEKALNFMRWIRPQIEKNRLAQEQSAEGLLLACKC